MKITNKLDFLRYLEAQVDSIYHEVKASIADLNFSDIVQRIKDYAKDADGNCPIAKLSLLF